MAYAQVIEGSDWKMGWASTQRSWHGFPQNISGRQYTGGNSFYLMMATMANNHTAPIYATFNQIQKMNEKLMDEKGRIPKEKWNEAVHVRKGEQAEIVVFNTPLYVNPDKPKEKPLTAKEYEKLSKEEKEKYNQIWAQIPHVIFNIDQTNIREVRPELYEKLVERMMPKQAQTFRQDTMGMYEEPAIDHILKNQSWRCPIIFDKESKDAFYSPSRDTITVPMKEQYNIPYTEKELDRDITKHVSPALSMKPAITDFSDADRQMARVEENKKNKEYLTELRATVMLENTFGRQLGMLRQDGQTIGDYARQVATAIDADRDAVIAVKDTEAKIIGGQDYYTTFLHEGAHSMHKELNIELNATGDKRGYAREEMRVESSTAMVASAMGYSTNMFINSAAYVRSWNETANIQEKTRQMQQLISDINKTVNRMGEIIDEARLKVGQEPIFRRSAADEQKAEQQTAQQPSQEVTAAPSQTPTAARSQDPGSHTPYPAIDEQPRMSVAEPLMPPSKPCEAQAPSDPQSAGQRDGDMQSQDNPTQRPKGEEHPSPDADARQASRKTTAETERQKLEAIGYPFSHTKSEDGSYDIPTVNESLYWKYAAGIISFHEAAREFTSHGWTNFVDEDYTRRQFSILNEKWQRLDDDLNPLSPEQMTWHKLSALLMDTSEDIHLKAKEDDILVLETDEDMGLSDLEKNRLTEVWQHPTEGIITFKMGGSNQELDLSEFPEFIPQVYNHVLEGDMEKISVRQQLEDKIRSLSELAAHTPKERPSDIVFVRDFNPDSVGYTYTAYGKDADRLAERVSSSVAAMRPEINGQRHPYATVKGGNLDAVRADLMAGNVHPVIIDDTGRRISNDTFLDYTKEERKAFLDSLKPEARQIQAINETLQRMGYPDTIAVPQAYEHPSARPELAIPHRFGHQEVALMEIKKSKDGSYRAGNSEEGYYPIARMDTNNLFEVERAVRNAEQLLPQNLVKELLRQVESGKVAVEKDIADGRYVATINDPEGRNGAYPRGFKQFTFGDDLKDEVLLRDDWSNRSRPVKVDPETVRLLVSHAEAKLGTALPMSQDTPTPAHKIEDFFLRNVGGDWRLSASIDGKKMPEISVPHNDVVEYKHGRMSQESLTLKSYGDMLSDKQQQSHHKGRGMR
jgi:antirestriction protein ArdC